MDAPTDFQALVVIWNHKLPLRTLWEENEAPRIQIACSMLPGCFRQCLDMNPSLQRPCRLLPQSFRLPLQTRSSSYSLCKQGRCRTDRSDRWCPRAILIALLFCWRNTDVAFRSSWSLQPGYCSGSHQLLLFPRYPPKVPAPKNTVRTDCLG